MKLNQYIKKRKQFYRNVQSKKRDIDRDGISDRRDCRPLNPFLQHVKPNFDMQQRLKKLPIFFTTGEGEINQLINARKLYTLDSKKVPKEIEILRQRFYSMIKKRPDVVGELERAKPRAIVFTKRGIQTTKSMGITYPTEKEVAVDKSKIPGSSLVVSRLTSRGRGYPYEKSDIYESGSTVIHELEHVKQQRKWRGKPNLQEKMKKGRHSQRKEEQLAYEAEERAEKKLFEYQSNPYEFSSEYEQKKELIEDWNKKHPKEKRKIDNLQKKFFKGYRELMED